MLKILYRLDELDNIEANLVAEAANRLGVGEFQFFQLAYKSWYGAELEPKLLEREFLRYMLYDKVPPWVRHYARNIIETDNAGNLDPYDEAYHLYDRDTPSPAYPLSGISKVTVVVLFTVIFMTLMMLTSQQLPLETTGCFFPPCYMDETPGNFPLP